MYLLKITLKGELLISCCANQLTAAYYINYFKLMDQWAKNGEKMDAEKIKKAMAYFATIGVDGPL